MLKSLYKQILGKLALSDEQLKILIKQLRSDNICAGPFVKNGKKCPNTMALNIKIGRNSLVANKEIRRLLNQHGVGSFDLWRFYLLFDFPARLSDRWFVMLKDKLIEAAKDLAGS